MVILAQGHQVAAGYGGLGACGSVSISNPGNAVFPYLNKHFFSEYVTLYFFCSSIFGPVWNTGKRQRFPLTPVSPECDIQPRSAVIHRQPGEDQPVEKFNTNTHRCRVHARALTEIMTCVRNQECHWSERVTVRDAPCDAP